MSADVAYLVEERPLRIVGTWPLGSDGIVRLSLFRWIFSIITQISAVYGLSLEVYLHCLSVDETLDAFLMDVSSGLCAMKILVMRFNWKYTYVLTNSFIEDWTTVKDSRHREIMMQYWQRGKAVSLMMLYLGTASGVCIAARGLPLEDILPFQMFKPTGNETTSSNRAFKVGYFLSTYCIFGTLPLYQHVGVLVLQTVHFFINIIAHCCNDGLFFSLTMHLCSQFEILKMNLAELEIEKIADQKKIRTLVKRHCHLALLADDLELSFNIVLLLQLLASSLLICIQGFMILVFLHEGDRVGTIKSSVIMVTVLLQLLIYTYAGQTLESRTEEIAFAAYDSSWYRFRGNVTKDLVMIIHRGNTPYYLTAGKFVSLNLNTFKEILKTSASYMSVLKVMMDV